MTINQFFIQKFKEYLYKFIWIILHRLKKLVYGAYRKNNISYSIYTERSKSKREHFKENNAQTKWLSRIDNIK